MTFRRPIPLPAFYGALFLLACLTLVTESAAGGPRDQAHKMFNRLHGVPPSPAALDAMAAKIAAGDAKGAALAAIDDPSGTFYTLMLKDLISRWTNADKSPRVELNDFTATVIGMIRDNIPFDTVLSADILYVGDPTKVPGLPAYSLASNNHYRFLETTAANLKDVLVQQKQSVVSPALTADATAGVMTTRGFATAFYKAGTNRRAVASTLETFLCKEMNQLADTTRPDDRVRRDVTRAPGGDSSLFRNRCAGCHAGMDALAGAFAHYDVIDGATPDADQFVYTPNTIPAKFNRNDSEFPDGFITTDDSWINNWLVGQNSSLGWHGAAAGSGAKELGEMLADSDAFATCMVQRAITSLCLQPPSSPAEMVVVTQLADEFKKSHNVKNLFADAAVVCTVK